MIYEAKVKYQKIDEINGREKLITELFLVIAVSVSDAETLIHKEMEVIVSGEFTVLAVKEARINELLMVDSSAFFYMCKVSYISIDEEYGKERKIIANILIESHNFDGTLAMLLTHMSNSLSDYEILSITKSKIVEVFNYGNDNS